MLRPSTLRGIPAFGCAASGSGVTLRSRSIVSSIAAGPVEQLHPTTSTPKSVSRLPKTSGSVPSSALPSSSIVTSATIGNPGAASRPASTAWCSSSIGPECFQQQHVHALGCHHLDLLAESSSRLIPSNLAQRLDANPQRSHAAGHQHLAARGCTRQLHSGAVDLAHPAFQSVPQQPVMVGAEGVRLQRLGSRLGVVGVDDPPTISGCDRFSSS